MVEICQNTCWILIWIAFEIKTKNSLPFCRNGPKRMPLHSNHDSLYKWNQLLHISYAAKARQLWNFFLSLSLTISYCNWNRSTLLLTTHNNSFSVYRIESNVCSYDWKKSPRLVALCFNVEMNKSNGSIWWRVVSVCARPCPLRWLCICAHWCYMMYLLRVLIPCMRRTTSFFRRMESTNQ